VSRGRRLASGLALAVAAAVVAVVVAQRLDTSAPASARTVPAGFARIVRTTVVERQQVAGTLDYSGSFTVANAGGPGVVTWLPASGAIVRRGEALYGLGHVAVPLLYGSRPAYRDLTLGIADGGDVLELQQNLRALGFTAGGALAVSGRFDLATLAAVEDWQRSLGQPVTGALPLGSVVFLPGAVRVSALAAAAGATLAAGAPILSATSARPAVLVPLDPGSISQIAVGDAVLVTMPDNTTVSGRVASIGRVATSTGSGNGQGGPSTPTIPLTVSLRDPRTDGGLDQAPVQVSITEQQARRVLAAPISALLAEPGGGYAVAVAATAAGGGTRLVPVTTGLFDDVAGRVEISGPGLAAGMRVQVPTT
jgi:peptidoglycan hydrolase-like protein with peptidoglycan-binding domain